MYRVALVDHPASYLVGAGACRWGMRVTIHIHLVLRLKMSETISPVSFLKRTLASDTEDDGQTLKLYVSRIGTLGGNF
jgi:hypothetical protein